MGKPTGFMEFARELPLDRAALERIKDWNEFHLPAEVEKLRNQAARCMDCGIPYCHTGKLFSGMASGCPLNNLIPEWNDLVYRNNWREALERLHKTNNFPEFTGRVCPAPCEGSCTCGMNGLPVTIKSIEYEIIERGWKEGWILPDPPKTRTGKTVAVVGAGPSGLSAAAQLNKAGHTVTVFERADRVGGLLMYGIPNMKLDKQYLQRRVEILAQEGISFVTGTDVGRAYPGDKLLREFDAVVLCLGATKPRDLPIEGRNLAGVHFAMDFLGPNTQALLNRQTGPNYLSAKDRDVIIIGGGDTGTDCVGTSIRQGCRSVLQIEILPRPALERPADNPWPEWPKVLRTDYGQEEAAALYGADPRIYLTTAKQFQSDEQGRVKAVQTVQVQWRKNDRGQFVPQEVPGTEQVRPTSLVLLAMGFLGPEQYLLEQLGVSRDARSNVKADYGKYSTSVPKVFAAGDARRGQSLVVWAMQEGRGAARECDRYLMGSSQLP